ncbi:alpha-L-rhamnosidase-related protein [Novipirellula artificiosorum]|uniref:alpha-L-rhamnosidase-related protein n=1 Tax=Novipirellula artificiosorum TaxID=2528016 RepID=UPI0011B7789C|nr:family 78 glycoside hydrolase catalytic domain [Novipirellula artificiosorum]
MSRESKVETVNMLVNKRDFPGWGHMLENDATTLWEHWPFSDNTFSHNHPMFGSVSQRFSNWLGGIELAADAVGFDRIELHPRFVEGLGWVKCSHRSIQHADETLYLPTRGRVSIVERSQQCAGTHRTSPPRVIQAFRA